MQILGAESDLCSSFLFGAGNFCRIRCPTGPAFALFSRARSGFENAGIVGGPSADVRVTLPPLSPNEASLGESYLVLPLEAVAAFALEGDRFHHL